MWEKVPEPAYKYVFFDLDGTLSDSGLGITNSVAYALKKMGVGEVRRSWLYKFVGPPLLESFEKFCGLSEKDAMLAVKHYREYYRERGIFENCMYEGVGELLRNLFEQKRTLALATSKPQVFAEQILDSYGIRKYFHSVVGSNLDGTRVRKDEILEHALAKCGVCDLSRAVMVGDREYDILGAKRAGVRSLGVTYGYGSKGELERAGADYIADSLEDVARILADAI